MDWKIKLLGQKVTSFLPEKIQKKVLRIGQRQFGNVGRMTDEACRKELFRALRMIEYFRRVEGKSFERATVVELGTGWHGSDPLCFWLSGAAHIITVDVTNYLDLKLLHKMIKVASGLLPEVAKSSGINQESIISRYRRISQIDELELEDLCRVCNIQYLAPARLSDLVDRIEPIHADVVYSYSVLQRLKPKELERELLASASLLKENGVALHVIHHADHNARHDRKLNPLSYLKYPDWLYNFLQTDKINYQNRLRSCEFEKLFESVGFRTIDVERTYASEDLLESIIPSRRFRHMSCDDLRCTRTQAFFKLRNFRH